MSLVEVFALIIVGLPVVALLLIFFATIAGSTMIVAAAIILAVQKVLGIPKN